MAVEGRVLVGLGLLWIPLMKYISAQLYVYLQSVQAYISPPIAAVFLLGVFLGRVAGIAWWMSGIRTLLLALVTAALIFLIAGN